jgi:hypothetical protein
MSALPPKADIETKSRDVRYVPKADIREGRAQASGPASASLASLPALIKARQQLVTKTA